MSNIIYLKLEGSKQGLISSGCSTADSIGNKYQKGRENEMLIYEVSTNISRSQNTSFMPLDIKKPIDKSSPLLSQALISNELLDCNFLFYRTSFDGKLELYYKIKLGKASIINLSCFYPNSLTHNDYQPQESVSFKYESITWEHVMGGTSSYGIWSESIF